MKTEDIIELWEMISPYIPRGDRNDAAESFVEFFDEHGLGHELEVADELPAHLKTASMAYFGVDTDCDDNEEY